MMDENLKKVVVFIPAYNEEVTIGDVIKKIQENYSDTQKKGYVIEIIVVNDGSRDKTVEISKKLGVKHIVTHPKNKGLGAATRSGMQTAYEMGADVAVKIDADFQHDPEDIEKVILPILNDEADAVFGSRFLGRINYTMPLYRKMGNSFFSFLTSLFTGMKITDGQTGLMAFGRRYLRVFEMFSDYNETQQLIIDAWRKKMRVIEVPVGFHKRVAGDSFISFKYPFHVIPNIIRLFLHSFPLKIFVPLGLLFLVAGALLSYHVVILGESSFFGDASIVILFTAGVQIIIFGLIADIISKK